MLISPILESRSRCINRLTQLDLIVILYMGTSGLPDIYTRTMSAHGITNAKQKQLGAVKRVLG